MLNGEKLDRPVVDLGGFVNSFSVPAYLDFKASLGLGRKLDREKVSMINTISKMDERVLEYLEIPFRRVFPSVSAFYEPNFQEDGSFIDEWGITLKPVSHYYARLGAPLKDATISDLDDYPWPDADDVTRYFGLADQVYNLFEDTDYSLVGASIWSGIFQQCWYLRGMDTFLMDLVINPDFALALLERVTNIYIHLLEKFLKITGQYLDFVETADDLGGQIGPLISPKLYRSMIKPFHAKLFETIHKHSKAKVFYHTCGAVMPLIDDLIDIGVDILNPIQPLPKMAPEELHARWGDRLIFHGGLDVQHLLPMGTPKDIRQEVRHYLDVFSPKRFILSPANTILPGTPPKNIVAAFKAAKNYRR